jgi:hypothetical protein
MRYTIQHYVIKFVSDLRQVGGFLLELRFPPPIKLTVWNIVESGVKHHNKPMLGSLLRNYLLLMTIWNKPRLRWSELRKLTENKGIVVLNKFRGRDVMIIILLVCSFESKQYGWTVRYIFLQMYIIFLHNNTLYISFYLQEIDRRQLVGISDSDNNI